MRYLFADARYADYDYDGLNRLTQRTFTTTRNLINNYSYYDSVLGTVDGVTYQTTKLHTEIVDNTAYRYTYDRVGNITAIEKGERVSGTNTADNFTAYLSYEYDPLGQLKRVNSVPEDAVILYEYDALGNILSESVYHGYATYGSMTTAAIVDNDYTPDYRTVYNYGAMTEGFSKVLTGRTVYTFDTSDDSYTTVDTTISYDEIGNPLTYEGATLTWQNGRQLASYNKGNTSVSYTYDSDGLRTGKTVNGAKSEYLYLNGLLSEEIRDGHRIHYSYDSYGHLAAIQYYFENNQTFALYYVTTNAQGDVLGLYTGAGVQVASYEYDAWGNVISMTDTTSFGIATINPIRYRGYYFDEETGWYYLQSRYYDPEIGRFISADAEVAGIGESALGNNVYAYCFNNPVNASDSGGNWPKWVSGALNIVSGFTQVALGTALGIAAGWTGIGVVAAGLLIANGAGTFAQGVGQVVNSISQSTVMREDNMVRTGVEELGRAAGGDNGAAAATYVYDTAVTAASIYATASLSYQMPAARPSACFVAGTIVCATIGNVPIENIHAGDLVWSEEPSTGKKALKRVVQTFVNITTELVHITVFGEEIVTTPEHPFYVPQEGWVSAVRLCAGDILQNLNGEYVVIEKIQYEILEQPIYVYNFEVEDFHTYFVGYKGILVHNTCSPRFNSNQQAVIDLARESRRGLNRVDATTLVDWAIEYGISSHGPMTHPARHGYWALIEHIKIFNEHIPIK